MDIFAENMFKMWKSSWESYVKTLTLMQEQGDKMFDLFFSQSEALSEETKKLVKEWTVNLKEAQKVYLQAVEENLKKIETQFAKK